METLPFIAAASEGNYKAMGKLLKGKAKKDKQNLNGQSALHKAAEKGHTSSVEMLIQNNAKIDIKDNFGDTPLLELIHRFLLHYGKLRFEGKECDFK